MHPNGRLGLAEWLSLKPTDIHNIIKANRGSKPRADRAHFISKSTCVGSDDEEDRSARSESSEDGDWSEHEAGQEEVHGPAPSRQHRPTRSRRLDSVRSDISGGANLTDDVFDIRIDFASGAPTFGGAAADPFASDCSFSSDFWVPEPRPKAGGAPKRGAASSSAAPAAATSRRPVLSSGSQGSQHGSGSGSSRGGSFGVLKGSAGKNEKYMSRDARVCFEYIGSSGTNKSKDSPKDGATDSALASGFDLTGRPLSAAAPAVSQDPFDDDFDLGFTLEVSPVPSVAAAAALAAHVGRDACGAGIPREADVPDERPVAPPMCPKPQPTPPGFVRPGNLPRRGFLISSAGHRVNISSPAPRTPAEPSGC